MAVVQKVIVNVTQPKPKPKRKRRTKKKGPAKTALLSGQIGSSYAISHLPPIRLFPQIPQTLPAVATPQAPINMFLGGTMPPSDLTYSPIQEVAAEVKIERPSQFGAYDENRVHAGAPVVKPQDTPVAQATVVVPRSPVVTRSRTGTAIHPPNPLYSPSPWK